MTLKYQNKVTYTYWFPTDLQCTHKRPKILSSLTRGGEKTQPRSLFISAGSTFTHFLKGAVIHLNNTNGHQTIIFKVEINVKRINLIITEPLLNYWK